MADGRRWLIALALVAGLGSGTHAQQLGDFGRVKDNTLNQQVLPALEYLFKVLTNRPHSTLERTMAEDEMLARVWQYLVAPHVKDWAFPYSDNIRKARLDGTVTPGVKDYYGWLSGKLNWLTGVKFESATQRYRLMGQHIATDLALLPPAIASVCAVEELDRQRQVALDNVASADPDARRNAEARIAENDAFIDRFGAALTFRYASYDYALNSLLVVYPDPEAKAIDAQLSALATYVEQVTSDSLCGEGRKPMTGKDVPLKSRVLLDQKSEGEFRK